MTRITTHVLDISLGRPAYNIAVRLESTKQHESPLLLAEGKTSLDGRVSPHLYEGPALEVGAYRITFLTGAYFEKSGLSSFYPQVTLDLYLNKSADHYHVPLLVSPFGYTTYRGS